MSQLELENRQLELPEQLIDLLIRTSAKEVYDKTVIIINKS